MQRVWKGLNSQLRYQIILPFLLLTLLVAVAGALVVFYFVGQSLRANFDGQLASVTRNVNDALIEQEQANLEFLAEVAFARGSNAAGTPGVAEALASGDDQGLAQALDLYFRAGAVRTGVRLDRLIAFDTSGQTVVDLERSGDGGPNPVTHTSLDLNGVWFTEKVLGGEADRLGDKYAGLIQFGETLYFGSIAPVPQGGEVVGGLIVAMRVDNLIADLASNTGSAQITLYDQNGQVVSSTFAEDAVAPMSLSLLEEFEASDDPFNEVLFSRQTVVDREYQFAFVPLNIRGSAVGILAPALVTSLVMDTWNSAFWPIVALIVTLSLMIFVVGILIARRITMPLEELARTSIDVAAGKLDRRARVSSENEIGQLAVSFNQMTEYLIRLYGQVQSEAGQRAAIVESITDGIVVVDDQGFIKLINRATRRLMGVGDDDPMPQRLSDIPMQKLVEGVPGFGTQRASDLYTLGEYIVRASIAPVIGADSTRSGYVCLLQDMTAEVAVDRAKTNFIGTISHELRTPLTVIGGNADLLLRGLAGQLENDQVSFIETIRQHANNMAGLLQNVIIVANLDAGVTSTELGPIELARPIDEANWRVQSQIKAKGITLTVQIPEDLRPVLADFDHVRQVVFQLLDNARRYTDQGSIIVRALDRSDHVRVEVQDTGRGIPPDMHEQIFHRFIRGDGASEGINSAERGIGLGLAICKQLIERQGGIIGLESVPGQGSTFFFTLHYANDTPSPEKKTPMAAAA